MPILAIDLGTSNVKASVVRRDGTLIGTGRGSIKTVRTADGGAEQDAERVWHPAHSHANRKPCEAHADDLSSRPPSCPRVTFPPIHHVLQAANRPAPCGPTTLQSPFGSGHFYLAELPDTNVWF